MAAWSVTPRRTGVTAVPVPPVTGVTTLDQGRISTGGTAPYLEDITTTLPEARHDRHLDPTPACRDHPRDPEPPRRPGRSGHYRALLAALHRPLRPRPGPPHPGPLRAWRHPARAPRPGRRPAPGGPCRGRAALPPGGTPGLCGAAHRCPRHRRAVPRRQGRPTRTPAHRPLPGGRLERGPCRHLRGGHLHSGAHRADLPPQRSLQRPPYPPDLHGGTDLRSSRPPLGGARYLRLSVTGYQGLPDLCPAAVEIHRQDDRGRLFPAALWGSRHRLPGSLPGVRADQSPLSAGHRGERQLGGGQYRRTQAASPDRKSVV